jgi:hypothetical protein
VQNESICNCGKINYASRNAANKQRGKTGLSRDLKVYKCAQGEYHLGHPVGFSKVKRFRAFRRSEEFSKNTRIHSLDQALDS